MPLCIWTPFIGAVLSHLLSVFNAEVFSKELDMMNMMNQRHARQKVVPLPLSPELGVIPAVSVPSVGSSEDPTANLLINRMRS